MQQLKSKQVLTHLDSKKLLKEIPFVEEELVTTAADAVKVFNKWDGCNVVMKLISPDIIHKTELNCVITGINSVEEVESTFSLLINNAKNAAPSIEIEGILIQKMLRGVELVVGLTTDKHFGKVIMFGLGGVFVEVLKDVSYGILPLTESDAQEMIRSIKGFSYLVEPRGLPPVDIEKLAHFICNVSQTIDKLPEIEELDFNPIIAYSEDICVVDARVVLSA